MSVAHPLEIADEAQARTRATSADVSTFQKVLRSIVATGTFFTATINEAGDLVTSQNQTTENLIDFTFKESTLTTRLQYEKWFKGNSKELERVPKLAEEAAKNAMKKMQQNINTEREKAGEGPASEEEILNIIRTDRELVKQWISNYVLENQVRYDYKPAAWYQEALHIDTNGNVVQNYDCDLRVDEFIHAARSLGLRFTSVSCRGHAYATSVDHEDLIVEIVTNSESFASLFPSADHFKKLDEKENVMPDAVKYGRFYKPQTEKEAKERIFGNQLMAACDDLFKNPNATHDDWSRLCRIGNEWVSKGHTQWHVVHGTYYAYWGVYRTVLNRWQQYGLHSDQELGKKYAAYILQWEKNYPFLATDNSIPRSSLTAINAPPPPKPTQSIAGVWR